MFLAGLEAEGLLEGLEWRLDHPDDVDLDDEAAPVLLAVSDNGPEMRSGETRAFMALLTIGQHFGRDHSTVIHAYNLIARRVGNDSAFRMSIEKIERELKIDQRAA